MSQNQIGIAMDFSMIFQPIESAPMHEEGSHVREKKERLTLNGEWRQRRTKREACLTIPKERTAKRRTD